MPVQLSEAVGVETDTVALHDPAAAFTVISPGHEIVGAWWSTTVTVKLQLCPELLVTWTVVVPTGKVDPEAGIDVTVPHSVLAVGSG